MIPGFRRSSAGKSGDEQRRTRRLTSCLPVGVPAATTVAVPCAGVAVRAAARQQQCRHVNLCFPHENGELDDGDTEILRRTPPPRSGAVVCEEPLKYDLFTAAHRYSRACTRRLHRVVQSDPKQPIRIVRRS